METLRTTIWAFAGTKRTLDELMASMGIVVPSEPTPWTGVICSDCKNEVEETTHYEGQDLCHGCFFYATKV